MDDIRAMMTSMKKDGIQLGIKHPTLLKSKDQDADYDELIKQFGREIRAPSELAQQQEMQEYKEEKTGGYAQRRLKQQQQSEQVSDSGSDEEQDGDEKLSALETRQRQRAAGDDPLQEKFRGVTQGLLSKYDIQQQSEKDKNDNDKFQESGSGEEDDDDSEQSDKEQKDKETNMLRNLIQVKQLQWNKLYDTDKMQQSRSDHSEDEHQTQANNIIKKSILQLKKDSNYQGHDDSSDEDVDNIISKSILKLKQSNGNKIEEGSSDENSDDYGSSDEEAEDKEINLLRNIIQLKQRQQEKLDGNELQSSDNQSSDDDDEENNANNGLWQNLDIDNKQDDGDQKEDFEEGGNDNEMEQEELKQVMDTMQQDIQAEEAANLIVAKEAQFNSKSLDNSWTLPGSFEEFEQLVSNQSPETVRDIINGLRQSKKEELMKDSRKALQVLYGQTLQYFYKLAKQKDKQEYMHALLGPIWQMTIQIPLYACSVARAKINVVAKQVQQNQWPDFADFQMFKLWITLFEFNETEEHQVLEPLQILFGQCLQTVQIQRLDDIKKGLLLIHLGIRMQTKQRCLWPEARLFILKCLGSALPFEFDMWLTYCPEQRWLWIDPQQQLPSNTSYLLQLNQFIDNIQNDKQSNVEAAATNVQRGDTIVDKLSIVSSVLNVLFNYIECSIFLPSFPEIFKDVKLALELVLKHCALDGQLKERAQSIISKIDSQSLSCISSRKPLNQNRFKSAPTIRQHTPKFEDDFNKNQNYDMNSKRAEERKLRRKAVREERDAMRMLRKDSAFVLNVRETQKYNAAEERDKKAKAAISFLQSQEADFKSGGQAGMNPHLKKKRKERK
eukprot:TRINITY_DN1745_c1_g3_i2.p1 TRINITY_DN1745_c1_g3~~TRINITY_DN1745_c1_g3_i2.p1  ORF type:complete len:931 (-),score=129.01 TRINITY_DN1745_c1_g3_i2:537-3053(-)